MNKIIVFIILLILTVWQLKSETLELTNEEKNILNSLFENKNEYTTIVSKTENLLNCQAGYLEYISAEFNKGKIDFAYTIIVNAKNDSRILKKNIKKTNFKEILNKKWDILEKFKSDYLLICYKNNNFIIFNIDELGEFYNDELIYFTEEFKELKYIKNIEDYDLNNPIISILNLNDSIFTDFYNYDIIELDSNFNFKLLSNYNNQIYEKDYDYDGINDMKSPPVLNSASSNGSSFALLFSLFYTLKDTNNYKNFISYPTIFYYNKNNSTSELHKMISSNTLIKCEYYQDNLFLLNDFNSRIDSTSIIYKLNKVTSKEETILDKSHLKKYNIFKNKMSINDFGFSSHYLFLLDYSNQVIIKCNADNLQKKPKTIKYSDFIKQFKSDLVINFLPKDDSYYLNYYNHSLIIKEQYDNDTDNLIERNVYKLPANLSSSDIIYFLEFKRNDKVYYMLKTNDIGFVLLEQP